jgi:hypothetical protein
MRMPDWVSGSDQLLIALRPTPQMAAQLSHPITEAIFARVLS